MLIPLEADIRPSLNFPFFPFYFPLLLQLFFFFLSSHPTLTPRVTLLFVAAARSRHKHMARTVAPVIKGRMFSIKRLGGERSRENEGCGDRAFCIFMSEKLKHFRMKTKLQSFNL